VRPPLVELGADSKLPVITPSRSQRGRLREASRGLRESDRTRVSVEFDVPVPMRDGIILRANVYRPEGAGPFPVLLARTPYDKADLEETNWLDPLKAAREGFIVVLQDTRGRTASEGEWDPLAFEREDGYDSVEWAASLAGSNGRVGMFGNSYSGSTQWIGGSGTTTISRRNRTRPHVGRA